MEDHFLEFKYVRCKNQSCHNDVSGECIARMSKNKTMSLMGIQSDVRGLVQSKFEYSRKNLATLLNMYPVLFSLSYALTLKRLEAYEQEHFAGELIGQFIIFWKRSSLAFAIMKFVYPEKREQYVEIGT